MHAACCLVKAKHTDNTIMRNIIIPLIFYYMVTLKSNKSNLNRKNPIFFLFKKNDDLYQPYSPKNAHEGSLTHWDKVFLFIQSVVFYTNVSCIFLEHVLNPDALIG